MILMFRGHFVILSPAHIQQNFNFNFKQIMFLFCTLLKIIQRLSGLQRMRLCQYSALTSTPGTANETDCNMIRQNIPKKYFYYKGGWCLWNGLVSSMAPLLAVQQSTVDRALSTTEGTKTSQSCCFCAEFIYDISYLKPRITLQGPRSR